MLLPINEYSTVFENNFTVCLMRTPAWMDSATKNAHIRKITRFNHLLSLVFFSPSPSHLPSPYPFFLSLTLFLPPLGENFRRIYTTDSLLSCIIRLIPKFLSSFALAPLSVFFFSFPLIFLVLLPFLLYSSFVFFFSLSPFPSLLLPFPFPSPSLSLPFSFPFPFPFPFSFSFLSLPFHFSLIFYLALRL